MSRHHIHFILAFLAISFLSACGTTQPAALPTIAITPSATLPPSATATLPTATPLSPTATAIPPTTTIALSPTPTIAPPTRTPWPTFTPRPPLSGSGGGVLSFVRTKDNGWGIYVINADGSDERRILGYAQALAYPEWSPDGSQIIFHKHLSDAVWSINVMDADGSNERRLTETNTQDSAPAWSPDGSQIVFSRDGDIWVMNADGSDARLLMDDPVNASGVDWSPDGSQIVFESARDGNGEIYIINIDGSNPRRLTNNDAEDWWPVWSPDGTKIAFMSELDGDWEIYIINPNGGNLRKLTENDVDDTDPAWSPDGSQIAFSTNRVSEIPFDTEIYVMDSDGSNPQQITDKSGFEWGLDWRPVRPIESSGLTATPMDSESHFSNDLRLTIIYDNTAIDDRLTPEWGFAALVEYGGHKVLFDTGGSNTFMDNMRQLEIDPKTIEAVVLSHEHGDHTGGLIGFLNEADQPIVYLPEHFSWGFKRMVNARTDVVEVTSSIEIFPGIYSTGQISGGGIFEQGLAIDLGDEIVVITGCAHPGVVRMTRHGRSAVQPGMDVEYKSIVLVIGGFHLMGATRDQVEGIIDNLRNMNVKKLSPTHCTGDETIALFAEILGDDYLMGGAGQIITFP